ncbi:MAG: ComEC/Rec2 family competence protein [Sphingomonadales bacterium]|nr:ComEC/Rec2 family competence protein [Sphingomonadales bacterium]
MGVTAANPPSAGSLPPVGAALQHRPWRKLGSLSSGLMGLENFLARAAFDRAPWVAVGFAVGVGAWFVLPGQWDWLALLATCLAAALGTMALLRRDGQFPYVRQSLVLLALALAGGCIAVWSKSALVGTPAIPGPVAVELAGRVLTREEQPAEGRVRLVLATREPASGRAIRVRINLPAKWDRAEISEGALVRLRARLMPPAPPMLPGGYDFARSAWFDGLAATGSALGEVTLVSPGEAGGWLARIKRGLSDHVRSRLAGTPGGIAAALASGDRGAIAEADEQAMRDAGLTHLLSISGLHVSAVIAAAYVLGLRLLALWPWLALRVRLPIMAAAIGALAGIAYTLVTGAEVPTVRSCVGAVLVLLALALGREPLSLRMLAVAALFVMLLWPEAVVGPSFQMSFASVIAIVALHSAEPVRRFLAVRDEPWWRRGMRQAVMLLGTGLVIELALMPIGLFHFHRAGAYGAFANVIAIPLTTFVTMPLVALALVADTVGAGAPFWWLTGKSLDLLLALAHWTAAQPGAVNRTPAMGSGSYALFLAGALWLALWRGRVRLLGLLPAALAMASLALLRPPDVLISGDGHQVALTGVVPDQLLVLREGRSSFARDTLAEMAGMDGAFRAIAEAPGAQCSADFCRIDLLRGRRTWRLLIGRSHDMVPERELAAACEGVDIVVSDRWLPRSCQPALLKADRNLLAQTGGLAIDLEHRAIRTVAETQGTHGWWRGGVPGFDRTYPRAGPQNQPAPLRPSEPAHVAGSPAVSPELASMPAKALN